MGRDRSRSRSRGRRRSRSRDRHRGRSRDRDTGGSRGGPTSSTYEASMQAVVALQQQQEIQRQQQTAMLQSLLAQQTALTSIPGVTMAQAAAGAAGAAGGAVTGQPNPATKKAREIYVGNLAVGVIGAPEVRELFNAALANFCPNPVTEPPVIEIKMDSTGRFAFVEMRTIELTGHMLQLDKMEVCGRPLKIGRPKGYEDEALKLQSQQKLTLAQTFASQLAGGPTNVVLLENLMPARNMINPVERREVYDDVFSEAVKCGPLAGVAVPVPEDSIPEDVECRVYVKFLSVDDAKKLKEMMDGRTFDDRVVKATYSNELDFGRAQLGEWVPAQAAPASFPLSSAPSITSPTGIAAGMVTIPGLPPGTVIPVLKPYFASGIPGLG